MRPPFLLVSITTVLLACGGGGESTPKLETETNSDYGYTIDLPSGMKRSMCKGVTCNPVGQPDGTTRDVCMPSPCIYFLSTEKMGGINVSVVPDKNVSSLEDAVESVSFLAERVVSKETTKNGGHLVVTEMDGQTQVHHFAKTEDGFLHGHCRSPNKKLDALVRQSCESLASN